MGRLSAKVAFVSGAASGIGAAGALRFAQEGAGLAAHFEVGGVRDEQRIREVVAG